MRSRATIALLAIIAVLISATPSGAVPRTTVERTIRDQQNDNLLEFAPGEDYTVFGADEDFRPPRQGSILNFLQLSDFQMIDEESPGRVEFLDGTQRAPAPFPNPFSAAYRPQESLTTQVTEAMVRAARNTTSPVTGELLDLAVLTGDNADSQQFNETRWFIDILDGTAGRRDPGVLQDPAESNENFEIPTDFQLADKIDPDSGVPVPGCEATPGSRYDGVRGGGNSASPDLGYYEPDSSGPGTDGDGYSPDRARNLQEVGRDVTVRDFPRLLEVAQKPFEAIGLDLPWYTAFGNHDALVQGNSPEAYFGPSLFTEHREIPNAAFHEIVTGCVKPILPPSALADDPEGAFSAFTSDPQGFIADAQQTEIVPPDERRCYLAKDEGAALDGPCAGAGWIQQHFLTTGAPVGHGFAPAPCPPIGPVGPLPSDALCGSFGRPPVADFYNDGYYSFAPKPGLRFVVLDTITDECGVVVCSEGSVDDAQFRWLEHQIQTAEASGEYVMVFSHHTLRTTRFPSTDPSEQPLHYGQRVDRRNNLNPQNPSGERTLEELFCDNPNVIAHVAGHEHENYVDHYTCDGVPLGAAAGPSAAAGGFWHISTAAHLDWPQQSRMIELIDNGNGTTSLVLTILDHDGPPNPGGPACERGRSTCDTLASDHTTPEASGEQVLKLASIAREISFNDYQACSGSPGTCTRGANGSPTDRNVIIVMDRPWPYGTE